MALRQYFDTWNNHKYSAISESDDSFIEDKGNTEVAPRREARSIWQRQPLVAWLIVILFQCLLALVFATVAWHSYRDRLCTSHVNRYWSPVQKELDVTYNTVKFNGSLFKETAFRGPAGPETDAAWKSLGVDDHAILMTANVASKAGVTLDHVFVPLERGGPGWPATVEALHQLHCLNLLRKGQYFNYEYYKDLGEGPFTNSDRVLRLHISHCWDMLRQVLMCNADIGLVPFIWVEGSSTPFPEFSREHTCRNFDEIKEWSRMQPKTTIDGPHLKPHDGAKIFPDFP